MSAAIAFTMCLLADLNGDCTVTVADAVAAVQAVLEDEPTLDLNGDGISTVADVVFVVIAINACAGENACQVCGNWPVGVWGPAGGDWSIAVGQLAAPGVWVQLAHGLWSGWVALAPGETAVTGAPGGAALHIRCDSIGASSAFLCASTQHLGTP
jgi:hypothetical protein